MNNDKKEEPPKVAAYLAGVLNWARFDQTDSNNVSSAFDLKWEFSFRAVLTQ